MSSVINFDNKKIKLTVIGEGNVGKSSWISRLQTNTFKKDYIPTLGFETSELYFEGYNFTIWDTAGQPKYAGLREGYYIGSDCCIIMISDTNLSYSSVGEFKDMIIKKCGNIPIIIVVNKCELDNTNINYNNLLNKEDNVILISCKENISVYEPLNRIINLLNKN